MGWTLTDDVGAYRAAVGELLSSEPERNTVLLSVLASLTRLGPAAFGDAAPLFGWWPRDGAPRAAVLQTPPPPVPGMRPSPRRRARWRPWMTWSPTGCTEVSCCSGRWRANRCRWPA